MKIFDHLLNPPLSKMTMVRNIFTSYRKFLAAPLVNEDEPVISIHILTSFTRRRKRQRSPRVWISAVLIFHSGDSEPRIKRSLDYSAFTNIGMENEIDQDCEAVYIATGVNRCATVMDKKAQ